MVARSGSGAHPTASVRMVRRVPVMFLEEIDAEVAVKVPPDRMNVIGVVLRVVILDQKSWPLQAVVMRLAAQEPTHPREADAIQAGLAKPHEPRLGNSQRLGPGVLVDDGEQQTALFGGEFTERDALLLQGCGPPLVPREDVRRRRGANSRLCTLRFRKALEQRTREVLLGRKHALVLAWAAAHSVRVAAEELRRRRD